jgi:serine/threonine protein kinase
MAVTLAQFLQRLEASGILNDADLAAARGAAAKQDPAGDAEPLIKRLHKEGRLTGYQAQALWKGKGQALVLGNYIVEDELGRGGMGVVLKACHKRMQRQVAIKVLPAAMVKDAAAIARFQREVVAAAKLTHTNIVAAFDADEINGQHILVMEFVDGRDLSSIVKKQGPLPVQQALDCIIQAARGLEFAHKQGVIHRDIKPANLLLDATGTVKILDMGLARLSSAADVANQAELTGTGTVMGTVDYMSPEQALSTKSADHRADIYSLGISLYYLLTGKPAYPAESLTARLMAHANAPIPSLPAARAEVSPDVQAVFERMVAKKAGDRYQSMTAVIADLEACRNETSGTSTLVRPKPRLAEESSDKLVAFLHQLGDGKDTAGAAARTVAKSGQLTKTVAEEQTFVTQADAGTERALPSRKKARGAKAAQDRKSPLWTDWRVLAGGGGLALLAILFVTLTSSDGEPVPSVGPTVNSASVLPGTAPGAARPNPSIAAAVTPSPPRPTPPAPRLTLARLMASPEAEWSELRSLGPGVNSSARELNPTLTDDELTLVFTRNTELWIAERSRVTEPFTTATRLPDSINTHGPQNNPLQASLSGDGLLLAMISDRPGSAGEDVWLAERPSRRAPFGEPVRLGPPVSSNGPERVVVLSSDGLTLLVSSVRPGSRGADIVLFTRTSRHEPFGSEQRLDPPVSTAGWDAASWISNDRCELLTVAMPGGDAPHIKRLLVRENESQPWEEAGELVPLFSDPLVSSGVISLSGRRLYFHARHLPDGAGELDLGVAELLSPLPAAPSAPPAPTGSQDIRAIVERLTSPDYEWSAPENLGPGINTAGEDDLSGLSEDELTIYVQRDKHTLLKSERARADGPFPLARPIGDGVTWDDHLSVSANGLCWIGLKPPQQKERELWMSLRPDRGSNFPSPERLPALINTGFMAHPVQSPDGLTLLATAVRGDNNGQIWMFTRPAIDQPFDHGELWPSPVSTPAWDMPSYISSDRLLLITLSQANQPGTTTRRPLLFTRSRSDEAFGEPQYLDIPLGKAADSTRNGRFTLSGDGRSVYFVCSQLPGGAGEADIWVSRRVPKGRPAPQAAVSTAELLTSPAYEWTPPENLGPAVNTAFYDEHPELEPDGLTLWLSGGGELHFARRPTPEAPFAARESAGHIINDGKSWDSAPAISPDGLELVFQSGRGSPGGNSNLDLFHAQRATSSDPFGAPVRLPSGVNSEQLEAGPAFSPDRLTLLFESERPGGSGRADLWQATRPDTHSEFGPPVNLGPVVNSRGQDRDPYLSADGTALLFASNQGSELSRYDLYVSTRTGPSGKFGPPVSLGDVVNSSTSELGPSLAHDGRTLYFYTWRPGGHGQSDLWVSRRVPKE